MLGRGHVWITPDVPSVEAAHRAAEVHGIDARKLVGFRSVFFSPVFTEGWTRMARVWRESGPDDCANSVFSVPNAAFRADPDFVRDPTAMSAARYMLES